MKTLLTLALSLACLFTLIEVRAETDVASASMRRDLPPLQEMIEARTDVWGDAAEAQRDGASYEFFKDLLPPLRWVNTDFRHYPIVLSAPRAPEKARLVSNGSAVNPRANRPPMWYEQGVPISFYVGKTGEPFGAELSRLHGPVYLEGNLPIVLLKYEHNGTQYRQEAFAPLDAHSALHGIVMLRFSIDDDQVPSSEGQNGRVEARIQSFDSLHSQNGSILDNDGRSLLSFSRAWEWDAERKALVAELDGDSTAELGIHTRAAKPGVEMSPSMFDEQLDKSVEAWKELLGKGILLETPEEIVNQAWRSLLIGVYKTTVGDRLHYSATNAYAKLYEAECGDVLRAVMLYGHLEGAPAALKPLLEFDRFDTRFHVAGHKLQLVAFCYWLTRDAETVRALEPLWRPSVELILTSREPESGLLPKDRYAGDIKEKVYSLNSNANCWRGLRDIAAVLGDMEAKDEAKDLASVAAEYRERILSAVSRSERLEADPPFIPNALLADEPAHDPLTATRTGSYYDLMCPYIIGSEIFGQGAPREDWLLGYLQNHGGISMGMVRTKPSQGQFKNEPGVVPLYGLRYQLALLRRDEREKALVGFYGHLAQGMARGTFIGGEGTRFLHGDESGRSLYLPPNSTSNATWLLTLRYLLIQDWDLDEDARPETLRLLFAAPRRWFAHGCRIRIENAPTMFGPIACQTNSRLHDGYVDVDVTLPPRPAKVTLVRMPLPMGWRVQSAEIANQNASVLDGNTVDLSGHTGRLKIRFNVEPN